MFVGDECHNQVTNGQLNWIPRNAVYRLGLSATKLILNEVDKKRGTGKSTIRVES